MTKIDLNKTYTKIAYQPDNNEWTFCNRAPNHSRHTYGFDIMFHDIIRPGSKFYMKVSDSKMTILEGAELLVAKMRQEKNKMSKDLKSLTTDPDNYTGTYQYCPQRGLIEMPVEIEKRNDTIKTWTKKIKEIKNSPEYLLHVLKK